MVSSTRSRFVYLYFLVVISILSFYSCATNWFIQDECVASMVHTFSAPCRVDYFDLEADHMQNKK